MQGGRRAGTPPPTGSALHTCVPGIWLAARSQRLAGGRAQRGEAGRACSRHLRKALMKGHSLPGASCHQHPGATRNEPKAATGGRDTGKGPLAGVSRSLPLTRHRRLPRCPTEPWDKGPPTRPQGQGVLRKKDSGRLQGWGDMAALQPGLRPRSPQQPGQRHPLLRRGGSGRLGSQEVTTQRSSQTPGVHAEAWLTHSPRR